jgi:hypothetical protein
MASRADKLIVIQIADNLLAREELLGASLT